MRRVSELRANPKVTVHYNPKKPTESALELGWGGLILHLVVSWLATLALWLTVILVLRAHRRRTRAHNEWKAREAGAESGGRTRR